MTKYEMNRKRKTKSNKILTKVVFKVSLLSIIVNAALSFFKMIAGIFGKSQALISDAVHSLSDVFSSIIVIIGVKISAKDSDKDHPYGHERYECVAAIILAVILIFSGIFIGYQAVLQIMANDSNVVVPQMIALVAAIVSIAVKEGMYWYTRYYAKKVDSGALMADAWHHRSDALSSVASLLGVIAARMGFPLFDAIASLLIVVFIFKASFDIFKDAIDKMVDRSCDEQQEQEIKDCALEQDGVLKVDMIHTRIFGNRIYVDIEICVNRMITLVESHEIASVVENVIEQKFPKVKHVMVHVNPSPIDESNKQLKEDLK